MCGKPYYFVVACDEYVLCVYLWRGSVRYKNVSQIHIYCQALQIVSAFVCLCCNFISPGTLALNVLSLPAICALQFILWSIYFYIFAYIYIYSICTRLQWFILWSSFVCLFFFLQTSSNAININHCSLISFFSFVAFRAALGHVCDSNAASSCLGIEHSICMHGKCICDLGFTAQLDNTVCTFVIFAIFAFIYSYSVCFLQSSVTKLCTKSTHIILTYFEIVSHLYDII